MHSSEIVGRCQQWRSTDRQPRVDAHSYSVFFILFIWILVVDISLQLTLAVILYTLMSNMADNVITRRK